YYDDAVEKLGEHTPAGGLRGGKYSLFEAGTRVPFSVYWKGKITPKTSNALVCQIDLYASLAELAGAESKLPDSQNLLGTFLGKSEKGRDQLIIEAGGRTALRKGDWAFIPPYSGAAVNTQVNIELGNDESYQLYDLKNDLGQQTNVAAENPEKLKELKSVYEHIKGNDNASVPELELH
ncbi:MAG: sulfatase-like hydrolase/transferase, partial [Maribacter dokdonensis]